MIPNHALSKSVCAKLAIDSLKCPIVQDLLVNGFKASGAGFPK